MATPQQDLGKLATEAQTRACDDPRRVAPELHWLPDRRGWVAGKRARALTKKRWGVRPARVVCRPGYHGIYIHGATERGITWLAYLNGDVVPKGETFKQLLEQLCGRVGVPYRVNGHKPTTPRREHHPSDHETTRPSVPRQRPTSWPFSVPGARSHAYPSYWVCVLPEDATRGERRVLQYRSLSDGSIAPGLATGRFWRAPGAETWFSEESSREPTEDAEWRDLPEIPRHHTYRHDRVDAAVEAGEVVHFLEGERDVETAESLALTADTNPGGAGKLTPTQAKPYRQARVVVIPDNDPAGVQGAERNARTLAAAGARVKLLEPLGGEPGSGFDFTDWAEQLRAEHPETWKEELRADLHHRIEKAPQVKAPPASAKKPPPLSRSVPIREFLATQFPPRKWIIRHLIQQKDIAMIYAKRGVGKTYAAQAIAWAVVTGGAWLRFEVEHPTGVLYIDGEMPREDLQERFHLLAAGSDRELVKPLCLLSEDIDDQPLPSLATAAGQRVVDAELEAIPEIGLVIIDAVSTLCNDPRANESDAKSWDSMQTWLLSLRRRGIASFVVHHSGKGGDQRGTSKREDVMTQVLRLQRPNDYHPEQGARFELHFVKARGVLGEAARPVDVQLSSGTGGALQWTYHDLEGSKRQQAKRMFEEGLKARDIEEELGVPRSTAFRWQKQWQRKKS